MIVGHNHHRLEKRISIAILCGTLHPRETEFLYKNRILHEGRDARLSDRQAEWLFAILTRCEARTSPSTAQSRQRAHRLMPQPQPKLLEPTFVANCLDTKDYLKSPDISPKHSSAFELASHGPPLSAATGISPARDETALQRSEPAAKPPPDAGSIVRRVILRNQQLRQRQERIQTMYRR
jgi:hypothetical protein